MPTDKDPPKSRHDGPMSLPVKIIVYTSFVLALTPIFMPAIEWWVRMVHLVIGVFKI